MSGHDHRVATADDLDACATFEWTRDRADLRWHVDAGLLFVSVAGDEVIGYARLESFWKAMPYLALIVVREHARGRGAGTALLAYIRRVLALRGYTAMLSSATATEDGPRRWHVRNGFAEVGTLARLNPGEVDEVFYRLTL